MGAMRCRTLLLAATVVMVGCSGDGSSTESAEVATPTTVTTTVTTVTTTTDVTTTDTTVTDVTTTDTTTVTTTTDVTTTDTTGVTTTTGVTVAAAPIVPRVVCVEEIGDVLFGYDNEAEVAVVVAADASTVTDAELSRPELVPTVFAPGAVDAAFWARPVDWAGPSPTWAVTGPDGVRRVAGPDDSTPFCPTLSEDPADPDPRQPTLEVTDVILGDDGVTAQVTVAVAGVPPESRCAAGLEARPVLFEFGAARDPDPVELEPGTARLAVELTDPTGGAGSSGDAREGWDFVLVLVLDSCAVGGVTQASWPGEPFELLYGGVGVCVVERDGTLVASVEGDDECFPPRLAPTGGSRSRPA